MKLLLIFASLLVVSCANTKKEETKVSSHVEKTSAKLKRAPLPQDEGFKQYAAALKDKLRILPRKVEREFTQGYVDYTLSGDPQQGQKLIKLLKDNVTKNGKKFDSEWISIFGGGEKLKEKKINLGVLSSTRLLKLLSHGDSTAIEFLLIYSAAVELNEEDARRIHNYRKIVKSTHQEVLKATILKNEAFLLDYPQAI